jgi:ribosome-associated protein
LQTQELVDFVIKQIEDLKGRDIEILDVKDKSTVTDCFVICSGNSKQHVKSIAENVAVEAKNADYPPIGVEGADTGEWVLVDLSNVVVHVMLDDAREFYQLEKLWKKD